MLFDNATKVMDENTMMSQIETNLLGSVRRPATLQETRRYIQDFIRLDDETRTALELYDRMPQMERLRSNSDPMMGNRVIKQNKRDEITSSCVTAFIRW